MDYKEIEKRQYDAKQFVLNPDGSISKNPLKCAITEITPNFDILVLCPFCLGYNHLWKFNNHKGLRQCPNCSNQMKLKTLTELNDINKFVKFIFDYRFNGFWSKIYPNFDAWKRKLWELGISQDFWDNYKRLKGE